MNKYIALILCSLSLNGYAQPEPQPQSRMNGEELLNFCEGKIDSKKIAADPITDCGIYIRSVIVAERVLGTKILKCAPGGLTNNQLSEVVIEYLHKHPSELRKEPAATMIRESLQEKYPCK